MLQMIVLRMWRERRRMLILFVGLCLVTAFLALGSLYVRAIAAAEFEVRLDESERTALRIDLTNDLPLDLSLRDTIESILGERIASSRPYITSGGATCGFQYDPDAPDNLGASTFGTGCYRSYAYPEFDALFALAEGRLPQTGAPEDIVEAVITVSMQEDSGLELGQRLIHGEDPDTAVTVEIVGTVEPLLPHEDPFWAEQFLFEEVTYFYSAIDSRQDRSFIFMEADYRNHLQPAQSQTHFNWRILLRRDTIRAGDIDALNAELTMLTNRLRERYPSIELFSTLDDLLRRFQQSIETAQPPITFLSVLVMVLMLYNMMTITALIQEQQMQEWALFASRGGSALQLVGIQFVTVGLLNLGAVLVGPLLALGLLAFLTQVGPQAAILDIRHISGITTPVLLRSAVAALALQLVLLLPAWSGAQESLLRLKREATRPQIPAWQRYGLDFVLIVAGSLLLLRLYGLATGSSLDTLLRDPALLIRTLAEGNIGLLLDDPFSLATPALLLTGVTLLWMRLFPLLIGAIGRLAERRRDLLPRLALWNIERDPAHYTRMVLLLIGTLALGTASLVLNETRQRGVWDVAYNEVGADAAVTLAQDRSAIVWESLPGVEAATTVFVLRPATPDGSLLLGIDSAALSDAFPQLQELAPLIAAPEYDVGGQALPDTLTSVRLDVYAAAPGEGAPPIRTQVSLLLEDRTGRAFVVPLSTERPEAAETFQTYRAALPTNAQRPLVFQQILILSEQEGTNIVRHTIYLDHLRGVTEAGDEVPLQRFEPDSYERWDWVGTGQATRGATLTPTTVLQTEGDHSLRVRYAVRRTGVQVRAPRLAYRTVNPAPIPVVLSPQMAVTLGQRARRELPLRVGDTTEITFDVVSPQLGVVKVPIAFTVVAIRESVNAGERGSLFLVADRDLLQRQINAGAGESLNLRANTVWLQLAQSEPQPETLAALESSSGVADVTLAWERYSTLLRAPLPNAISGVLFAGFWVSLLLSLMDFAFYLNVTIRQRATSFATLRALGWGQPRLLQLLLLEQILFVLPALVIGVLVGLLLTALIVPFLALSGSQTLQLPLLGIGVLLAVLVISFTAILRLSAVSLRRMELSQVMRFGD